MSSSSTQTIKDAMAALNQEVMQLGQSLQVLLVHQALDLLLEAGILAFQARPVRGPEGDVIDADFTSS
ncbi:Stromal 70 kDa heat shock-related protein, partial [Drosera capensis]